MVCKRGNMSADHGSLHVAKGINLADLGVEDVTLPEASKVENDGLQQAQLLRDASEAQSQMPS